MTLIENILDYRGTDLLDRTGEKIGRIEEIYLDTETNRPEWALVNTGLFGMKGSFVPIGDAFVEDDAVYVPIEKERVEDAPRMSADGELSQPQEAELYRHYGMPYREGPSETGLPDREHDAEMIRSEEELRVGTTQREHGGVRLRKFIVTEGVQSEVAVSREEARVEREPIRDAEAASTGGELSEEEREISLRAEEPVVEKRVVPRERVHVEKDVVTEQQQVPGQVRKEQIEVEGPQSPPDR